MDAPEISIAIRDAQPEDKPAFMRLWRAYLDFYEADVSEEVSEATWRRVLDPQSTIFARLACVSDSVIGFAACTVHENTWNVAPVCYLEDLFVDADRRGRGVGRALLRDLIARGEQHGWARLYWHTRSDNARARRLYDSFVSADDFVRYRIVLGAGR